MDADYLDRAVTAAAAAVVDVQIKGGISDRYKYGGDCECMRGRNDVYCWRCVTDKCLSLGAHISIMSVFESGLDPATRAPLMKAIADSLDVKVQCRKAIRQAVLDVCGAHAKIAKSVTRRSS